MADLLTERIATLKRKTDSGSEELQAWRDDIAKFYSDVKSWLNREITENSLFAKEQDAVVQEPDFGRYSTTQLAIQLNSGPLLLIIPRGIRIVGAIVPHGGGIAGAQGRIDLVNFADRRSLAFFRGLDRQWFIPTPDESTAWAVLDKDRFRAAMASLL